MYHACYTPRATPMRPAPASGNCFRRPCSPIPRAQGSLRRPDADRKPCGAIDPMSLRDPLLPGRRRPMTAAETAPADQRRHPALQRRGGARGRSRGARRAAGRRGELRGHRRRQRLRRGCPTAVCGRYPGVRLLSEAIPGPGPARNRGAGHGAGRDPRLRRRRLPPRPGLDPGDRPRLRRPRGRDHRRRRPHRPARPRPDDRGRGLRERLQLPHPALHRARPLHRHRQHGAAPRDLRRGRALRRHRRRRGHGLGPPRHRHGLPP